MKSSFFALPLAGLALGFASSPALAVTFLSENFELGQTYDGATPNIRAHYGNPSAGGNVSWWYGYAFGSGGAGSPDGNAVVQSGVGVGGSLGLNSSLNLSPDGGGFNYGALAVVTGLDAQMNLPLLSDYHVGFAASGSGFSGASGDVFLRLTFITNAASPSDLAVYVSPTVSVGSSFQDFAFTLADFTLSSGSALNAGNLASIVGVGIELRPANIPSSWGADTGNVLSLDNVSIASTPIPEPSSFAALSGLAVLASGALRRRRSA